MAMVVTATGIALTVFVYVINGKNFNSTVEFSPSELMRDSHLVNNSLKLALRYGFQKTSECNDFSKAFICVQKCLDLGYDVAYSNRHCFCTCYQKKEKSKFNIHKSVTNGTKWKLGAPTTKLPAWAKKDVEQTETTESQYFEGNRSDVVFGDQTENSTLVPETGATGHGVNGTNVTGGLSTIHDADNTGDIKGDNSTQTGGEDSTKDVSASNKGDDGTPVPNKVSSGSEATTNNPDGTETPQRK